MREYFVYDFEQAVVLMRFLDKGTAETNAMAMSLKYAEVHATAISATVRKIVKDYPSDSHPYFDRKRKENGVEDLPRDEFPYHQVREEGECLEYDGWHNPDAYRYLPSCGCTKITDKGAYRDEIYQLDGVKVYYLHQNPIVIETEDSFILDSCMWRTKTTKERINGYLPYSVGRLFQSRKRWFVGNHGDKAERFYDGMKLLKDH